MTTEHHDEIRSRFDALRERIAAQTITRGKWEDRDSQGRDRVCLLLALAEEVRVDDVFHEPSRCPAWLLPPWLAELTPWIDDESSMAAWPAMLLRFADVVGRAAIALDAAAWRRCDFATRRAAVLVAYDAAASSRAMAACDRSVALCDRVLGGDEPTADEWDEARATARAAAWAARAARAAWAAHAAHAAAWAASQETEQPAAGAAEDAVSAVAEKAKPEKAAAEKAAAADRIIAACLDAIERETIAAEAAA